MSNLEQLFGREAGMRVLIVEDDQVDRIAATRSLEKSGLGVSEVVCAKTAEEAVEFAAQQRFELILLDYQIPPFNGIEVLRMLRGAKGFSAAVIMLSHSSDETLALKCIEAGAQDFIMKSELSAVRLKRAILLAKERYQLEKELVGSHEKLKQLAETDTLTGLANRYFFDGALRGSIATAKRENRSLALILIDLDKFKFINDTFGHNAGDELLIHVAKRLQAVLRETDIAARLGGDEFAIMTSNVSGLSSISTVIAKIFSAFKEPVNVQGRDFYVSISMGVAIFPECASSATELMKCADVAMYRSKDAGRNQVHYYSTDIHEEIQERIMLERELVVAIESDQLELFYQPQICTQTNSVCGAEALIRWRHPELGMIFPDKFIPVAEDSGLIVEIGRWVIAKACQQYAAWLKAYDLDPSRFQISVNLSPAQLKDVKLIDTIRDSINEFHVPPKSLELELTESSLEVFNNAKAVLNELCDMGVSLALDDFGVGHSSLSRLSEYPFETLKIDKVFVQHSEQPKQADFLQALTAFALSLRYEVVAEGVETQLHQQLCTDMGIHKLQGYYFSKPVPVSEFQEKWLLSTDPA